MKAQSAIVGVARKFPGEAAVLMGIVHAGIYDAVVAIEGGGRAYAVAPTVPPGASAEVATAAAAHGVLVGLLPDQQGSLDAAYAAYLSAYPDDEAKTGGMAVGEEVAAAILTLRADDGRNDVVPYVQAPPGPGVFEPTAPAPPVGTNVGGIAPLTLPRASQFRPSGPPRLPGDGYADGLNEVAVRGRADSPTRTPEETAVARFWTEHGVPQWNRVLFRLIAERHLGLAQAARLLATAHAAGGDAMIGCFEAKYHYRFWRPVHAIQRAGTDGNDRTVADPAWTPLLGTPNHPEYPAAHGCHSAAMATAAATFLGTDDVPVTIDNAVTGQSRSYDRLSAAVEEVIDARILGGMHYRFSGDDGASLGVKVGRFAATRFVATG